MKLGDYAALQLGSEILEEFEEHEMGSDEPHDYHEGNTSDMYEDEDRFIENEEELDLREKWPWYNRSVPKHVIDILKSTKEDCTYHIPGGDMIINDLYARNLYELYCNPRPPEEFFNSLAKQYMRLVDLAPDKVKFHMLDVHREDFENETIVLSFTVPTFGLVRNITHPMAHLFGYKLEDIDELWLSILLREIFPTGE